MTMVDVPEVNNVYITAEIRHEQILREAALLFWKNGYERTSIKDIASAVGIQTSSLYYHFTGKENILVEIMSSALNEAILEVEEICRRGSDAPEQLEMCLRALLKQITNRQEPALLDDSELKSLSPASKDKVIVLRDRLQNKIENIISLGMKQGHFIKGDVKLITYGIIALVQRVPLWFNPQGRLTAEEIAKVYYKLIIDGLRGTKSEKCLNRT